MKNNLTAFIAFLLLISFSCNSNRAKNTDDVDQSFVTFENAFLDAYWKQYPSGSINQKEFEAVYLRIPRCETNPVIWEISFHSDHDRNHTFSLTMSGFEAKEILIDG